MPIGYWNSIGRALMGAGRAGQMWGRGPRVSAWMKTPYARAGLGALGGMAIHAGMSALGGDADWSWGGAALAGAGGAMMGLGFGRPTFMRHAAASAYRLFNGAVGTRGYALAGRRAASLGAMGGVGLVGLGLMSGSRSRAHSIATARRRKDKQRQMLGNPRMMY